MATNEDIVVNFPENAVEAIEASCCVEAFDASFDAQNQWLLLTPFNAAVSGIAAGMIARIVRSGFSQGSVQTYVIRTVTSSGFVLSLPGQSTQVGRGPGAIFGIDIVKAKILDMSPMLEKARMAVDARYGTFRPDDPDVQTMKSLAVQRIMIARAADSPEFLASFVGSPDFSVDRYESRVLEMLGADLLRRLARVSDGAMYWPRVCR